MMKGSETLLGRSVGRLAFLGCHWQISSLGRKPKGREPAQKPAAVRPCDIPVVLNSLETSRGQNLDRASGKQTGAEVAAREQEQRKQALASSVLELTMAVSGKRLCFCLP